MAARAIRDRPDAEIGPVDEIVLVAAAHHPDMRRGAGSEAAGARDRRSDRRAVYQHGLGHSASPTDFPGCSIRVNVSASGSPGVANSITPVAPELHTVCTPCSTTALLRMDGIAGAIPAAPVRARALRGKAGGDIAGIEPRRDRVEPSGLGAGKKAAIVADQGGDIAFSRDSREGQRELPPDAVDTRHPQSKRRIGTAIAGRQSEAPDRRHVPCRQPIIAQRRPACREHALHPVMPGFDKPARQTDADKIAARRQLAAEADGRAGQPPGRLGGPITGSGIGTRAAHCSRTGSAASRRAARKPRGARRCGTSADSVRTSSACCRLPCSNRRKSAQGPVA